MKNEFLFSKTNYTILLIGIAVIAFGFLLMIGGGNENPNEFSEDIFSFRRIHLAPALVLLGMGISFYSIFKKDKKRRQIMSEILKALIVGIVQGLTEFLPVSSSGHIVIAQEILGLEGSEQENLLFAIVLHFATALSTIVIFRKDIIEIFRGLFQFKWNEEFKFALKIVLSMIPAALVGVFLKDTLEELFSNLRLVGFMLLITATLLFIADRAKNTGKDISFKDAGIIGIAQAFAALLPGISRSGTTISTSILLGDDKGKAARFSFLMVLPLILGATAKMYLDMQSGEDTTSVNMEFIPLLVGFLAAFISGLFACKWMIEFVKKAKLKYFSAYCTIVGLFVVIYTFV